MPTEYILLEKSLPSTLGTNLSFNLGQTSSMSSVTSTIFILLVSVSFVASLGMVAYSGLLRMKATSPNEETEARNILQRAVYGPIGIIVMYLLLLTINPSMLRGDLGFNSLSGGEISKSVLSKPATSDPNTTAMISTEDGVRSRLSDSKININNSACVNTGQTRCTSVGGLSEETIQLLTKIKSLCNCEVVITGGTEYWLHSNTTRHRPGTRANGGGAVDLRKNEKLNNYIKNTGKEIYKGDLCYAKYSWSSFTFCDEINKEQHWHIQ